MEPIETAPLDGTEVEAFDADGSLGAAHFHCGDWLVWGGHEIGWEVVSPAYWTPLFAEGHL